MNFDLSTKWEVHVDMFGHVYVMIDAFTEIFDKKYSWTTPAGNDLFNEGNKKKLSKKQKE